MPTNPANDRFEVPVAFGEDGYDTFINNNFDVLAVKAPVDKPLADRQAASNEFAPQRFYAVNEGIEYYNTGASWRPMGTDPTPFQMAGDGLVVPIAPGVGYLDAIDTETAISPVQDAIDAIETVGISADGRYGAGTVLLPPGVTETSGNLHSLGGKRIIGHGREASILEVADSSANCFALGGAGANKTKAYLDGFTISGGSRSGRTAGSAITAHFEPSGAATADMVAIGFNIGRLQFQNWGGPDPVIHSFPTYSSRWDYIRALDYDGQLFVSETGFSNDIGMIHAFHDDPTTPMIEFQEPFGSVQIGDVNIGGAVGRAVQHNGPYSTMMNFRIGKINVEPDASQDITLPSGQAPIELNGSTPTQIQNVSIQENRLSTEHVVLMGDNQEEYPGNSNVGIGKNSIGPIAYNSGTISNIGLKGSDIRSGTSWYWGQDVDVTRNGHSSGSIIPMADVDFTP